MRVLHFEGTPAHMGEAFGESCREAIAELYALRLENALAQALRYGGRTASEAELLALARACLGALGAVRSRTAPRSSRASRAAPASRPSACSP